MRSGRKTVTAALVASVAIAVGLLPTPAAACHEPYLIPFTIGYTQHRVVAQSGDPGVSMWGCNHIIDSVVLGDARAQPGDAVVSMVSGLNTLPQGTVYRIRFEGGLGSYAITPKEFAGGQGPAFTANWAVPSSALGPGYKASVIDPAGVVVGGSEVPFTVGHAQHRVATQSGDLGISPGASHNTVDNLVSADARARPGDAVVSVVNGLRTLPLGAVYRIRFEGGKRNAIAPQEFAGGNGPGFAATWAVPTTALGSGYKSSVIDPSGAVVPGTEIAFTVSAAV